MWSDCISNWKNLTISLPSSEPSIRDNPILRIPRPEIKLSESDIFISYPPVNGSTPCVSRVSRCGIFHDIWVVLGMPYGIVDPPLHRELCFMFITPEFLSQIIHLPISFGDVAIFVGELVKVEFCPSITSLVNTAVEEPSLLVCFNALSSVPYTYSGSRRSWNLGMNSGRDSWEKNMGSPGMWDQSLSCESFDRTVGRDLLLSIQRRLIFFVSLYRSFQYDFWAAENWIWRSWFRMLRFLSYTQWLHLVFEKHLGKSWYWTLQIRQVDAGVTTFRWWRYELVIKQVCFFELNRCKLRKILIASPWR